LGKRPPPCAQILYPQDANLLADRNGQDIVGAYSTAGLGHPRPVKAHVPGFNELSGRGALFHDPGEPEPLVDALCQFFLLII
jgi:hypothetical protein